MSLQWFLASVLVILKVRILIKNCLSPNLNYFFKGWSERLELQEQYADIREERMDQLTESLVSCMTSETDSQDLDDFVIRQLREENEKLK